MNVLAGSLIRLSMSIALILSNTLTEGCLGHGQILVGHGHFGGYYHLLLDRLETSSISRSGVTENKYSPELSTPQYLFPEK